MPFEKKTRDDVNKYVKSHLADEAWHRAYFSFIKNKTLTKRLSNEFMGARFVYKLLEGMKATKWLRRSQIRLQILQYAGIYEAVIHYLLFSVYHSTQPVKDLLESQKRTRVSISAPLKARIAKEIRIPETEIVVTRVKTGESDITKIRFEIKAEVATTLGLIDDKMKDDLIEIFSARNAIHIHAEIRKGIKYQLNLSKKAYRRLKPFREQIVKKLKADGKI
jgi:hypothetical protein